MQHRRGYDGFDCCCYQHQSVSQHARSWSKEVAVAVGTHSFVAMPSAFSFLKLYNGMASVLVLLITITYLDYNCSSITVR